MEKKTKLKTIVGMVIALLIGGFILLNLAGIGLLDWGKEAPRYKDEAGVPLYNILADEDIKATGNYTISHINASGVNVQSPDPTQYGKWKRMSFSADQGDVIDFIVRGDVSLCTGWVQPYNPQQDGQNDNNNKKVPIPRLNDKTTPGVPLTLDAKTGKWHNLAHLHQGDLFRVLIGENAKVNPFYQEDRMNNNVRSANCLDGQNQYNPICGKWSLWKSYVDSYANHTWDINEKTGRECKGWDVANICIKGYRDVYNDVSHCCRCSRVKVTTGPPAYLDDDSRTFSTSTTYTTTDSLVKYRSDNWKTIYALESNGYVRTNPYTGTWGGNSSWDSHDYSGGPSSCAVANSNAEYNRDSIPWWYIEGKGVLTRHHTHVSSSRSNRGSNYAVMNPSTIIDYSNYNPREDYEQKRVMIDEMYNGEGYYQVRLSDSDGNFANNTGGYVFFVKQTKCYRQNGNVKGDAQMADRGLVQLYWSQGEDPNTDMDTSYLTNLGLSNGEQQGYTVPRSATLWMRLKNVADDYQYSDGSYNIKIRAIAGSSLGFETKVSGPLITMVKDFVLEKSMIVFQNMTCYGQVNTTSCYSFFSYLRGVLTLYIMSYGFLFLLGMVEMTQKDLVIRVSKIAFVAGLMGDKTFNFFYAYAFPLISASTEQIIANIGGYPVAGSFFSFADPIMSDILFNQSFWARAFALWSLGPHGIFYFLCLMIALIIFVVAIFKSITVFLMAYTAQALLISIAPVFFSFMLFEKTRYLFDNWVKFTIRYIIEPVVLFAGLIILTKLFTIFVDAAMPYSAVKKCAIKFKIPFAGLIAMMIPGVGNLANVPLFCLPGYGMWGFDISSNGMVLGIKSQKYIVLFILSYTTYGYINFSTNIVQNITGVSSPAASAPANKMNQAGSDKLLGKVGMDSKSRQARMNEMKGKMGERKGVSDEQKYQKALSKDRAPKPSGGGTASPPGGG